MTARHEAALGPQGRRTFYLERLRQLALRAALSGRAGGWLDIARRVESAGEGVGGPTCDTALHAAYLELDLWGQLCRTLMLPQHRGGLDAAIHRVAREETRDAVDLEGLSLWLVCSDSAQAPDTGLTGAAPGTSLEELALIRQLKEATRRPTIAGLQTALRTALALPAGSGAEARHAACRASDVLGVRAIFARALAETMPYPHRRVLAAYAQRAFYAMYAPDEPEPRFIHQVPRTMARGEGIWAFSPIWAALVCGYTKVFTPERGVTAWLIGWLECVMEDWERDEAEAEARVASRFEALVRKGSPGAGPERAG